MVQRDILSDVSTDVTGALSFSPSDSAITHSEFKFTCLVSKLLQTNCICKRVYIDSFAISTYYTLSP